MPQDMAAGIAGGTVTVIKSNELIKTLVRLYPESIIAGSKVRLLRTEIIAIIPTNLKPSVYN